MTESPDQAAERHLGRGCVGAFQSAEWALVKWLTLDSELGVTALSGCTVMWLLGVTTEQAGPLLRLHPNELQGPLSSVGTEVWRLVFLLSCHLSHG